MKKLVFYQLILAAWVAQAAAADVFRVATFNVENYVDGPGGSRPLKTTAARAKVCESIVALKPDVISLQEMGSTNALMDCRRR